MFSILFITKNITNFLRNHLLIYLNQKIDISIILSTYSKVILLPYVFYVNKKVSEVLSRINDLSYLKNFISKMLITIFLDSCVFIVSFIMIYSISRKILLYFIVIDIIYILIILIFNNNIKSALLTVNDENVNFIQEGKMLNIFLDKKLLKWE